MKQLFSIVIILFLCLVSCNEMEEVNGSGNDGTVNISAEFPDKTVDTRAVSIPSTHKLRCIIEVWATKEASKAYRAELAIVGGELPEFKFTLPDGEYECLMWADCIEEGAEVTDVAIGSKSYKHYADLFYDTGDLRKVSILDKAAKNMFDTDLCDAYFARMDFRKQAGVVNETLKLKRPFSKIVVKENETDKLATLKKFSVKYSVPSGFNVSTGEPLSSTMRAEYEKVIEDKTNSVLFTNYIFTPSSTTVLGEMGLVLTTDGGKLNYLLDEGVISLQRNQIVNAGGNLIASAVASPIEPVGDPQIGDYFFADGTWRSSFNEENRADCIGIIFALGEQNGDDISTYGEAGNGKKILGYVMAMKNSDMSTGQFFPLYKDDAVDRFPFIGESDDVEREKFNGYANTYSLLNSELFTLNRDNYPVLKNFEIWLQETAPKPTANASPWYIPSFNQLIKMVGYCYGYAGDGAYRTKIEPLEAFKTSFQHAISENIASNFVTNNRERPLQCSTLRKNDSKTWVIRYNDNSNEVLNKSTEGGNGYIRPVFTILK